MYIRSWLKLMQPVKYDCILYNTYVCILILLELLICVCSQDSLVLSNKEKECAAIKLEEIQQKYDEAVGAMNSAKKHFQAVSVGMSTTADGQAETLAQQKMS